jgi:hypothetical protein
MRLTLLPDNTSTFDVRRIGTRVSLGRKEGCDIIVNEAVVSGNHCYITVLSKNLAQIEDVSTNGTYVNNVKIGKNNKLDLREGDTLTLGKPNAPAPAGGACVNFRVTFDGSESESAPQAVSSSMIYKKEIEDLKVQVSQGEFRNDNLSAKNSDLATRYSQMDIELRRINENNVELSVRNDSMKTEIETLRARLAQTEQRAVSSDRRAETIEAKLAAFEREHGDIAALKAELNLRNVTLREEIERLRRSNMDLSNKLSLTSDARRRIISNLTSLQAGLGTSIRLVEDLSPNPSDPTGTMRMAESPSTRVVANSSAVQPGRRTPIRGVPLSYTDEPVESVAPGQTSTPPIIDDQNFLEDDRN